MQIGQGQQPGCADAGEAASASASPADARARVSLIALPFVEPVPSGVSTAIRRSFQAYPIPVAEGPAGRERKAIWRVGGRGNRERRGNGGGTGKAQRAGLPG